VVRRAACPVIVVPRGAETPLEDMFQLASTAEATPRSS
jgi:hypothetical protein